MRGRPAKHSKRSKLVVRQILETASDLVSQAMPVLRAAPPDTLDRPTRG